MSYTEIYAFNQAGNAYLYGEVKNAWAGAVAVWRILEERYLPPYIPKWVKETSWYHPDLSFAEISSHLGYAPTRLSPYCDQSEIWNLGQNSDVAIEDRIVLYTTYDKPLVKKEDLPKVIDAFRRFDGQTNLSAQADILEKAYNDPDVIAIGWNQTSISADHWGNYGGYDEVNDCSIPYNCLTGTDHFWIFGPDELEV